MIKRTYVLESPSGSVLGYYNRLYSAKQDAKTGDKILALKGQYFGEGFHQYRLTRVNGKFKRERLK